MLGIALAISLGVYFLSIIGGLMMGTLTNTATDGSIPVSAAMNTSLAGIEADFITFNEKIVAQPLVIVGLLIIVILATIFGFKGLGKYKSKGKSGME